MGFNDTFDCILLDMEPYLCLRMFVYQSINFSNKTFYKTYYSKPTSSICTYIKSHYIPKQYIGRTTIKISRGALQKSNRPNHAVKTLNPRKRRYSVLTLCLVQYQCNMSSYRDRGLLCFYPKIYIQTYISEPKVQRCVQRIIRTSTTATALEH